MSLLGLDVGTTGCKAVAFDLEGRPLAAAYREYPLLHPEPSWSELDTRGIFISTGSACSAASLRASHVLLATGLSEREAHGAVRLTLSKWTTPGDIADTVKCMAEIIGLLGKGS